MRVEKLQKRLTSSISISTIKNVPLAQVFSKYFQTNNLQTLERTKLLNKYIRIWLQFKIQTFPQTGFF